MRAATTIFNFFENYTGISIHAAHAGSDFLKCYIKMAIILFQSTLPMRAAT